ncbi:MAG: PQQ-binding-like beta-propeller repeat protein [Anaerohalosphaera sp.]|nr:PQQ-binding-like beta-propeller repeat protein [Anaerohalosphaera sp.]
MVLFCAVTTAQDWPTYLHDKNRSAHTTEQLPDQLRQAWVWGSDRSPRPAGAESPALQDFWQGLYNNKSRLEIDSAFRVVASSGKVYFGSSNSDKVICLDAGDGSQLWKYYTGGPIRFAPSVYAGKVYFGSDDGYVYCLNADDGSFVWKYSAIGNDDRMMADGRMVSVCPVRTGVLVDNGVAYWGAGLFSGANTNLSRFICACNAETGVLVWKKTPPRPLQGYPLASASNLYMPAGKTQPTFYNRLTGGYLGSIGAGRQGGAYALLTNDNKLFIGPHYSGSGSYIAKYDASSGSGESMAWGPGNCLVVTDTNSYYSSDTKLARIRRSDKAVIWTVSSSYPYELILAGTTLFAGGNHEVAAISTTNGSVIWTAPVNGRVRGLAVAGGSLYVSTDHGSIHCFTDYSPGDLDRSNSVDLFDFVAFAVNWLTVNCGDCGGADLAGQDGLVDINDLLVFIDAWLAAMQSNYE